jgi:spore coat-associated protein N
VTRLSMLAAHPRRTLGALAVALVAIGLTVGSGANFTASAANPGNVFATGSLSIANSPSSALFSASGMKPGDVNTGTVDIENTGTLSGVFALGTANASGDTSLLAQLDVVVGDCGAWSAGSPPSCASASTLYSGKIDALTSQTLGTYAAAAKRRYKFTVTLPSNTNDTFQGKSVQVDFAWSATQT